MIAKVIVGDRSHVDYDGFVDQGCCHFCAWGDMTVILLFFGPHRSSVRGVARAIAKVIVGSRSHVDYDGFVHHGCCHFGVWGDVTVILLFFGPPLSTVRGVARVIAKVIVGSRSHVDYDGFVHHGCRRSWTPFSQYGCVTDVHIPLDHYTGEPRDFVYVQYPFLYLKSLILSVVSFSLSL